MLRFNVRYNTTGARECDLHFTMVVINAHNRLLKDGYDCEYYYFLLGIGQMGNSPGRNSRLIGLVGLIYMLPNALQTWQMDL